MLKYFKSYGLLQVALSILLTTLTAPAQDASARHERIRAAVEKGDHRAALDELRAIGSSDPAAFAANNYDYLLARLSDRLGDSPAAAANYQKVAARSSVLSQYALWHLAELARLSGNLQLEREKLRQLIATAPDSLLAAAAMARLGKSFYESADYTQAIQTLRPKANAKGDASAREALSLLGSSYLLSGQKGPAREAFNSLVAELPNPSQPDDFALAAVRGLDQLDSEGSDQKTAPQLPESEHMRRAQIYNFNRDFAGARRHYQAVVERYASGPNVPEALYMIARGFYQEVRYEEALPFFQRVVKDFPDSSNARDALGFAAAAYSRLKRVDEAVAAYKTVAERYGGGQSPERPFLNIIDAYRDAGRDQEALSWAEQTRARFKGQLGGALALFSQARIHLSQGAWEAALNDFEALKSESNLGSTQTAGSTNQNEVAFMRAFVLEQMGRIEEAVGAYLALPDGRNEYYGGRATARLRGLAVDPKGASAVKTRADSLKAEAQKALAAGQFEDARRAATQALRLTEDSSARSELLEVARGAYKRIPAYNLTMPELLQFGRRTVNGPGAADTKVQATHKAIADELLFLGLYDEGAPELAAAGSSRPASPADTSATQDKAPAGGNSTGPGSTQSQATQPNTPTAAYSYTLAHLYNIGGNANQAIRYAEPVWKKVPSDYLLELAPREMVYMLYPAPYRDALLEYAPPRGVDPRFVLSIMRQESRFRPEAKSVAAARGLLQFIPSTADRIAGELKLKDFRQDDLYSPRMAVLFGSQYMGNLFRQFPEMPQAVAASYNGGEDNVARWVARARSNDQDRYVLEIGFAQSKDYVYKVLPNYWVYKALYDEQLRPR